MKGTQYTAATRRASAAWRRLALVVAATVAVACGGDAASGPSAPPAPTSPVGIYALSTVGGKSMPARLFAETNYSLDVAQGSLALTSGGTFTAVLRLDERVENHLSTYVDTNTGTWKLTGTTVTFTTADGMVSSGTWAGRNLTLVDSSGAAPVPYVYTMP